MATQTTANPYGRLATGTPLNRMTNKELVALTDHVEAFDADGIQALSDELGRRATNARRKADDLQALANGMGNLVLAMRGEGGVMRKAKGNGKARRTRK